MKIIASLVSFLVWVAVYLLAVSWAARYRYGRTHALPTPALNDYRADRDLGLKLFLLVFGLLSFGVVYYLNRALG
jgi:hypothetical protein